MDSSKKKILAIIPARGGSKGIPRKNILSIAGKPLIAYSIEAAAKSKYIDKLVLSSEDEEILAVARRYGVQTIKRPMSLAKDRSRIERVILHALDYLKRKENYVPEAVVKLYPTSPLRRTVDIDEAIKVFLKSDADSLISVQPVGPEYLKTFLLNDQGYLVGAVNNRYPFTDRQKLPKVFWSNGAVWIFSRKFFMKNKKFFSSKTLPYIMSENFGVDLDTPQDLKELEIILAKRKKLTS